MKTLALKKISPILLLLIGFLLGYLIFNPSNPHNEHLHSDAADTAPLGYTCSMHPQIRQDKPGKCPICGMDLTPVTSIDSQENEYQVELSSDAQLLAKIHTQKVRFGNIVRVLNLPAEIKNNLNYRKNLNFQYSGRIEVLNRFGEGQKVKKGELLAQIYSPDLTQLHRELLEAIRLKNQTLISATETRFRRLLFSEKVIDSLKESTSVWERFPIESPSDGTISNWYVSANQYVEKGTQFADLDDDSVLWVEAEAFETDAKLISLDDEVILRFQDGTEIFSKVQFISSYLKSESRTRTIRMNLDNKNRTLLAGTLLDVLIKVKKEGTLVIPKSAILWTGKQSLVYRQVGNHLFELTEIRTGIQNSDEIEVLSGLTQEDAIVVEGVFRLDSAAQLAGKISMMHPSVAQKTEKPQPETNNSNAILNFEKYQNELLNSYIQLKNELVASDAEQAFQAASQLKSVIQEALNENSNPEWTQSLRQIRVQTNLINTDNNLESLRNNFISLSNAFIQHFKRYAPSQKPVFIEHCPMANQNKGADWLSYENEIRNPYFGDMMLTCGEVITEL